MIKKRRVTKCYFDLFLKKFNNTLFHILLNECRSDIDEYLPIAYEQLMYTMIHFDPQKYPQINKGSFHTFLYHRVRGITRHALRKALGNKRMSLMENVQIDNEILLDKDNDLSIFIKEIISKLTSREQDVVKAYFLESKTLAETAIELGVSTATVGNDRNTAIEKLKRIVMS